MDLSWKKVKNPLFKPTESVASCNQEEACSVKNQYCRVPTGSSDTWSQTWQCVKGDDVPTATCSADTECTGLRATRGKAGTMYSEHTRCDSTTCVGLICKAESGVDSDICNPTPGFYLLF